MATPFGIKARSLREQAKITQFDLAERVSKNPSYLSNIEQGRKPVTESVLSLYAVGLGLSDDDIRELRRIAEVSNAQRQFARLPKGATRVISLIRDNEDTLTDETLAKIEEIITQEIRQKVKLKFRRKSPNGGGGSIDPRRFIDIALCAERLRRRYADDGERLDIQALLEGEQCRRDDFEFDVLEELDPKHNAYALCEFRGDTTVMKFGDKLAWDLRRGQMFARHTIAHEIGHVELHSALAQQNMRRGQIVRGSVRTVDREAIEEREADYFATLLLVPWKVLFGSSDYTALSFKYGVGQDELIAVYKLMHVPLMQEWFYKIISERG